MAHWPFEKIRREVNDAQGSAFTSRVPLLEGDTTLNLFQPPKPSNCHPSLTAARAFMSHDGFQLPVAVCNSDMQKAEFEIKARETEESSVSQAQ